MFIEKLGKMLKQRRLMMATDPDFSNKLLGFLCLILSTTLVSLSGLFCKLSSLNGVEISWGMGVGATCLCIAVFSTIPNSEINGWRDLMKRPFVLSFINGVLLRGSATYVYFLAMDYVSISDALVISLFFSIVWATLLETVQYKIKPHWMAICAALIGLAGMVLMCKPGGFSYTQIDFTYLKGVLLAALSGCLGSTYYVNVNKLSSVPALWHWVSYPIGLMLLTKPEIALNQFQLSGCTVSDRVFALLSALFQILGGLAGIKGTQLTLASASFVVKLFGIVLTFILQISLLPTPVKMNSVIGGTCIIIAIVLQFVGLSRKKRPHQKEREFES